MRRRSGGENSRARERERGRQLSCRKTIRRQIEGTDATTSLTSHNRAVTTVHSGENGQKVRVLYKYCGLVVGRWATKIRKKNGATQSTRYVESTWKDAS